MKIDAFTTYFQMLRDRFKEFARDTESIGQERVAVVNEVCDRLISSAHSDAAVIAEWKDTINELWADLLEMIDTRTQMLAASYELFKFYNDCKELLERIRVRLSCSCCSNSFFYRAMLAQSAVMRQ